MVDIREFGAKGDGVADDTAALRAALAAAEERGGDTVPLTPGIWRTGPLRLGSGVRLRVEEGATLSFIPRFELYPAVRTRWEGVECWGHHPLLFASGATDIALSGGGTLDGNGQAWWAAYRAARAAGRRMPETAAERELAALNTGFESQPSGGGGRELQFLRPPLVQFFDCSRVRIEDVGLVNSPFWNTHLVYCADILVSGVRFSNPPDAPNTDGLDLDSCRDALVRDCDFDVGDDCLGLKSGSGEDGLRVGRPTERVAVRGCTLRAGHGGVVVGSETAGGVRDVEISDCRFLATERGLRIKTRRGRGGAVENISLRDCVMTDVLCPLVVNCWYGPGGPPASDPLFSLSARPVDAWTPRVRGIRVQGLRASGCRASAGFAVGLPESPIEGLEILDSSFCIAREGLVSPDLAAMSRGLPPAAGRGIRLRNVRGLRVARVTVTSETEGGDPGRTLEIEEGVAPMD
ncbi:MAG: hypothetical protein A2Z99_04310 [Treponema sp. GWB1_62_6]|nr:MAG: hypothetical protein A2Y36_05740 [Treponema sp. GWA1_62_8]OHE61660.1 MAG: hypothetical protein A2Z99_04310 [Treponema sp. GWB1_62_6]OHE62663.1 MAG: hypothetical protein A2001_21055 [Treponema sp. GWC1_61_84]